MEELRSVHRALARAREETSRQIAVLRAEVQVGEGRPGVVAVEGDGVRLVVHAEEATRREGVELLDEQRLAVLRQTVALARERVAPHDGEVALALRTLAHIQLENHLGGADVVVRSDGVGEEAAVVKRHAHRLCHVIHDEGVNGLGTELQGTVDSLNVEVEHGRVQSSAGENGKVDGELGRRLLLDEERVVAPLARLDQVVHHQRAVFSVDAEATRLVVDTARGVLVLLVRTEHEAVGIVQLFGVANLLAFAVETQLQRARLRGGVEHGSVAAAADRQVQRGRDGAALVEGRHRVDDEGLHALERATVDLSVVAYDSLGKLRHDADLRGLVIHLDFDLAD